MNWIKKMFKRNIKDIVSFTKEGGLWYFDFPNYPFAKHNLLMVNGSDFLLDTIICDQYPSKKPEIPKLQLEIEFSDEELEQKEMPGKVCIILTRQDGDMFSGFNYKVDCYLPVYKAYFCPVMYFKYKQFPRYIRAYYNLKEFSD